MNNTNVIIIKDTYATVDTGSPCFKINATPMVAASSKKIKPNMPKRFDETVIWMHVLS